MGDSRCEWVNLSNSNMVDYHDREWGVPVRDDQVLFEMLSLEGAQAGLSWEIVLSKREGYREVFKNFDPDTVSELSDDYLVAQMNNPKIIRNRRKILSIRNNAKSFQNIQKEFGSFSHYLWSFVQFKPIHNAWREAHQLPQKTILSERISKDLQIRGMNFVGAKIMYAFLQAVGVVNDHTVNCFRHREICMK